MLKKRDFLEEKNYILIILVDFTEVDPNPAKWSGYEILNYLLYEL